LGTRNAGGKGKNREETAATSWEVLTRGEGNLRNSLSEKNKKATKIRFGRVEPKRIGAVYIKLTGKTVKHEEKTLAMVRGLWDGSKTSMNNPRGGQLDVIKTEKDSKVTFEGRNENEKLGTPRECDKKPGAKTRGGGGEGTRGKTLKKGRSGRGGPRFGTRLWKKATKTIGLRQGHYETTTWAFQKEELQGWWISKTGNVGDRVRGRVTGKSEWAILRGGGKAKKRGDSDATLTKK